MSNRFSKWLPWRNRPAKTIATPPVAEEKEPVSPQASIDKAPGEVRLVAPSYAISYETFNHLYAQESEVDSETFFSNLLRTVMFTESIVQKTEVNEDLDYSRVLRTTNPQYKEHPFYIYETDLPHEFANTPGISFNYAELLSKAMDKRPAADVCVIDPQRLGRILAFEIDVTTHDGVPVFESAGFVDNSDIPPIDTWFFITHKYLYCWIPTLFIPQMQAAINVEMLDSYHWLDQWHPALSNRMMKRLGNR